MNHVNLWWFIFSQIVYGIGAYVIMSALFQLRFRKYIWSILIILGLNSIINYIIYFHITEISFLVPIISVIITFLYLAIIVRVPIIWSFVVTSTGSIVVPLVLQLGVIFGSFGFFSPPELKEHIWKNYVLDITSGLIYSLMAFLLYVQGWGFQFDFEKIRFKFEKYIIIIIASLAAICLPLAIVISRNSFTLNLTFLSISSFLVFLFLLGYAIKKERDEVNFLKPNKEVKRNE